MAAARTARAATRGKKATTGKDDAVTPPTTKTKASKAASATPTRSRSGTARRGGNGNTSPYFDKKAKGKQATKSKRDEVDDELSEPTGLTSESELSSDSGAESAFDPESDDEPEDDEVMNGDESESDADATPKAGSKRKATVADKAKAKWGRGAKGRQSGASAAEAVELGSDDDDVELEEGQVVAGRIYPAPKTGQGGSYRRFSLANASPRGPSLAKHAQLPRPPPNPREQRPRLVPRTRAGVSPSRSRKRWFRAELTCTGVEGVRRAHAGAHERGRRRAARPAAQ